jgi:hypothetical protein
MKKIILSILFLTSFIQIFSQNVEIQERIDSKKIEVNQIANVPISADFKKFTIVNEKRKAEVYVINLQDRHLFPIEYETDEIGIVVKENNHMKFLKLKTSAIRIDSIKVFQLDGKGFEELIIYSFERFSSRAESYSDLYTIIVNIDSENYIDLFTGFNREDDKYCYKKIKFQKNKITVSQFTGNDCTQSSRENYLGILKQISVGNYEYDGNYLTQKK